MVGTNRTCRRQSRVLRACDSCTHSKQRCDGQHPWARRAMQLYQSGSQAWSTTTLAKWPGLEARQSPLRRV
ncbi:hypothetical protein N7523_001713 [Penicillium sp. IBT 18751x]|nr:hypothetical protein N7523_001713 [Penicillium sp. IBT 18751x]